MISHPNIAYILLTLASIGLITEISNPGLIFPGVIGGLCLFLAFYSLGVLNAYWAGLLLDYAGTGTIRNRDFCTCLWYTYGRWDCIISNRFTYSFQRERSLHGV